MSKEIAKKVFYFGKHAVASNRRINLVTLTVTLTEDDGGRLEFSVQGDAWNNLQTDIVWGGQCIDTMMEQCPELRDDKTYMLIHDLWKKHHLNGVYGDNRGFHHVIPDEDMAEIKKLLCIK